MKHEDSPIFNVYMESLAMSAGNGTVRPYISETMQAQVCSSTWNVPSMIIIHKNYEILLKGTLYDMQ